MPSTSKAMRRLVCERLESTGWMSGFRLFSRDSLWFSGLEELGRTIDGSSRLSILMSIGSRLVQSAEYCLEYAVEILRGSWVWNYACGGKTQNGNSWNNSQPSSSDKSIWTYELTLGVLVLTVVVNGFLLLRLYLD